MRLESVKFSLLLPPDDGFSGDRTGAGDEEEGEDEDDDMDQAEIQRRKDRLEREQWLREQVLTSHPQGRLNPCQRIQEKLHLLL